MYILHVLITAGTNFMGYASLKFSHFSCYRNEQHRINCVHATEACSVFVVMVKLFNKCEKL